MLTIKSLHIIFMVTWMAGLFYLPRLFVYHAQSHDEISHSRFCVMERKLFYGIATPGMVLTIVFGTWLWWGFGIGQGAAWLHLKLLCVLALLAYHVYCGVLLAAFKQGRNSKSHVWFRWFNEAPVLALVAIVFLVVLKPF